MNAFLTNIRQINSDIHLLGIANPTNINILSSLTLTSGQPIIAIIDSNKILAFYLISNSGELYQVKGSVDLLFELTSLDDLSIKNLKKYNTIKYFLSSI